LFSGLRSSDFLQDLISSTFLATHIEDSRSGSLSCERSESSADEELISLKIDCFPIPKIAEVVSQPVRADTIIIWHALYADEQFGKTSVKGRIIIKCSDTDVLVLCAITIHACRTRINYN
jgi:hypothetical protein